MNPFSRGVSANPEDIFLFDPVFFWDEKFCVDSIIYYCDLISIYPQIYQLVFFKDSVTNDFIS